MTTEIRTNAGTFLHGEKQRLNLPFAYRLRTKLRSLLGINSKDDFEWDLYDTYYRAEIAWNDKFFTEDLRNIDFRFIDGKIFILGDCKPLNLSWRCVYEAVYNLPPINSLAEIGVGGGRYTANLRTILGEHVRFSAYDISEHQLSFFQQQYPEVYRDTKVGVLDLTESGIDEAEKPEAVLASTVVMHIQRPDAYQRALQNLLGSTQKYVILMDNWNAHDYFADLSNLVGTDKLFFYDSGANIAIIVNLTRAALGSPYQRLNSGDLLKKYLRTRETADPS